MFELAAEAGLECTELRHGESCDVDCSSILYWLCLLANALLLFQISDKNLNWRDF